MTCSNDLFSFFVYDFENINDYNSIVLRKQKHFIISPKNISLSDVHTVFLEEQLFPEPNTPFPQADSFGRVIDLLGVLADRTELSSEEVTTLYTFDPRQSDYYINAGRYLGLIEKRYGDRREILYYLSSLGKSIMAQHHRERMLSIMRCMFRHAVFRRSFELMLHDGSPPTVNQIFDIMLEYTLYNVNSDVTRHRRASSVRGWLLWILEQTQEDY